MARAAGKASKPKPSKPKELVPTVIGATGLRQSTPIAALAVSADGSQIATGDGDGHVRVFSRTGACLFEATWHARDRRGRHGIQRLAFSRDGSLLTAFTGINDHGNLCVAHIAAGVTWCETAESYESYAIARDGSSIAVTDRGIHFVNPRDGTTTAKLDLGEDTWADELAWSDDGAWIVASYYDSETQKTLLLVIDGRTHEIRGRRDLGVDLRGKKLAFGPDGRLFAVIDLAEGARVVIFDPATSKYSVHKIEGELPKRVWRSALFPARAEAVLVANDGAVVVDLLEARVTRTLPVDTTYAACSHDGTVVATAHAVALRLWDRAWNEISSTPGLASKVEAIAFAGDHVTTCDETGLRTWTCDGVLVEARDIKGIVALTPDGKTVVVASDGRTQAVDIASGSPRGAGIADRLNYGTVSPDGRLLAVRNYDTARGKALVYSLETGKLVHSLAVDSSNVYGKAFSWDNKRIAAGGWVGVVRVFDVASGKQLSVETCNGSYGQQAFSFSRDGTLLANGDHGKTVRLWKLPSGKLAHTLVGHRRKYIRATAISPDGTVVASADEADIRLWDAKTGAPIAVVRVGANCLAFSDDGTRLAAGGDGAAYVIDLAAPTEKRAVKRAPTPVAATAAPAGDEAALLAAIAANPDDDAPRLVLADLLTSRGDPRGELIVLMCGPQTEETKARIDALLESGWKAYAGPLAAYASQSSFERGFVHRARMTIAAFVKHGERLFSENPLHTLFVANSRWDDDDMTKLANAPGLARVRTLIFDQPARGQGDPLAALGKSKHLARLERLELMFCGHSTADWKALLERMEAPKLASIQLRHNLTSAAIQAGIARNAALANLREYDEYVYKSLDAKDAARRASEAYTQLAERVELHRLNVEQHEHVGDDALIPLFARGAKAALRSLSLSMTGATNALLRAIAKSPKTSTLENLELHDEGAFSLDGVTALLQSPHATALHRLAITTYGWSAEDTTALEERLLSLPKTHALREVTLPGRAEGTAALRARFRVAD